MVENDAVQNDESAEETTKRPQHDGVSVEELAEANERLQERVDELEELVTEIHGSKDMAYPADPYSDHDSKAGTDDQSGPVVLPSGGMPYKVRGQLEESAGGVGVIGYNTAGSGTTYGVWGEVDSTDGYGLATPDALEVGQNIDASGSVDLAKDGAIEFREIVFSSNGKIFANPTFGPDSVGVADAEAFWMSDAMYIQFTEFGPDSGTLQRTAGPVAKGWINSDTTIEHAVNVDSVSWGGSYYEIALSDDDYWFDEYATYVTSGNSAGSGISWGVSSSSPNMRVYPSDGNQYDFQFVTHKLIDGQATTTSVSGDDTEVSEEDLERSSTDETGDQSTP